MAHTPANDPSAQKQLITPQLVLDTLRHWWLLAVPAGLMLAAAAGAVIYVTFEPVYEAKVLLRIRQDELGFPFDRGVDRNFARNQIALVRSSPVLGPVMAKREVFSLPEISQDKGQLDPVELISRKITFDSVRGSDLYHLTATSSSAAGAALIANAVAEEYLRVLGEHESGHSQELIQALQAELTAAKQKTSETWAAVRKMTIDQTGRDPFAARPDVESSSATAPIIALQSRIMLLESESAYEEARLNAAERRIEQNPLEVTDAMLDDYISDEPRLRQMQEAIWKIEGDLSEIKSKSLAREKDRLYVSKLAEKKRLETVYEGMRAELRIPAAKELKDAMVRQRDDSIMQMRSRLKDYGIQRDALLETHRDELSKVKQFSGVTLDLEIKRQELTRSENLVNRISDRIFALRTSSGAPPRVEQLEVAKPPVAPLEATPTKRIVMAGGAAFALPFFLAFLWELRLRRLSTVEQLEDAGRLPVLGETARFPVRSANANLSADTRVGRALRTFEESVESVRQCIALSRSLGGARVLGITSATSQEGKTTLAAQLAVSIAKSTGKPTLLIDADMRAPDLHEVFDTPLDPGLAEMLATSDMLDEAIMPTWMENLSLIPGGRLASSPHKLLGNGRLAEVMEVLRGRFPNIILDTPPVLSASESLLMLSQYTDATVICAMRDVSRVDQVRKTSSRLIDSGANVVGCVFNGVPQRRYEYAYGKYYYQ